MTVQRAFSDGDFIRGFAPTNRLVSKALRLAALPLSVGGRNSMSGLRDLFLVGATILWGLLGTPPVYSQGIQPIYQAAVNPFGSGTFQETNYTCDSLQVIPTTAFNPANPGGLGPDEYADSVVAIGLNFGSLMPKIQNGLWIPGSAKSSVTTTSGTGASSEFWNASGIYHVSSWGSGSEWGRGSTGSVTFSATLDLNTGTWTSHLNSTYSLDGCIGGQTIDTTGV